MIPWRRDRLLTPGLLGLPGGSDGKESACNVGDLGSIPGLGRSPGGEHGHPLHGQRSLAGCSPWGHKKSDMTEQRTTHTPGKKQSQDVDTFQASSNVQILENTEDRGSLS